MTTNKTDNKKNKIGLQLLTTAGITVIAIVV